MARLLPVLTMVALTLAILPNSGCGKGIFDEVKSSATATTPRTVTPTSTASPMVPSQAFSMRGSGTQISSTPGTCSGLACHGLRGHCQCIIISGTLLSGIVGNSNFSASVTVNIDDCTNTGTFGGFCCNGDGLATITNGQGTSANLLDLTFTGPFCVDPNSSTNLSLLDSSLQATFDVLTASSTGKFLNATGTGQLNLFTDTDTGDAYLAAVGEIQLPAK